MAARYRKIDPRIWTDERFRLLTGEQQRIALYALTAQSNRIGLFSFSPGKACEDLGTLPSTFRKGFQKVCQALNWGWDSEARVLYLPTWWKYNQPENANNMIGNLKDLDDLPKTPLLEQFSSNTTCLSEGLSQTFSQTFAKRYPQRSLKRSASQEQEQEQEQEQDTPPAVESEFEEFWECYPKRKGKRLGKPEARAKYERLTVEDRALIPTAARNYAASEMVQKGIGIKDAHRWLRASKESEPWRDWIEPEQASPSDGHGLPLTCTKRVQAPGDRFLRSCGQPASESSRPTEPRCADHLTPRQSLGVAAC